ncbi:MAG TPA: hypothetical protein VHL61_11615 [Luteimonas sp.]|jgi:hypothetical protein|nr:hypothetical protein [Luteimonas sp.]
MNAFAVFPERLHWNPQQLTDAVPLRLHELFAFEAAAHAGAANGALPPPRRQYAPRPPMPERFSVR